MNIVAELFAPSHQHARRERDRMELVVDDVGSGAPGRGPIDLASGKVVISLGAEPATDDETPEDAVPSDAPAADAVTRTAPEDAVPSDAPAGAPVDAPSGVTRA